MPKLRIEKVLTFSTEDPLHPATNILSSDPARKWKCARPGEKMASVVLQLEKAMQITGVDIGNENSGYIEVLVSRSSSDEYKPLLGMSAFMTPLEARSNQNINKVRMFTSSDFSQPEGNGKWDRVKIVCIQPYNKHIQYGLSFVTIHTNEGAIMDNKKNVNRFTLRPDSPTRFSIGSLFQKEKEKMYSIPSSSLKGAAAIREASTQLSLCSFKAPIIKIATVTSPKPSTSKDISNDIEETNRNRNNLLYDNEDEAPNEKIDRLIEKKKQEDAMRRKLTQKEEQKHKSPKTTRTGDGNETNESRKRKADANANRVSESPKKRRASEVLKDLNTSAMTTTPKAGPSASPRSKQKRGTSPPDGNENCSPKKRQKVAPRAHPTKHYENLLEGVVFVISGIQNPERANLRTSALAMGAKYKADWDDTCTHLICAFANTPKFNQVRGKGKIVKKQWVIECDKQRKRLPWRRFCLDRRDNTGHESEEEIWEEVEVSDSDAAPDESAAAASNTVEDEENERVGKHAVANSEPGSGSGDKISNTPQDDIKGQNNTEHGREVDDEVQVPRTDAGDLPVLPNYFSGLKFYLSENLAALKKDLTKYIIAYDGLIAEDCASVDDTVLAVTYSDDAGEVEQLRKYTDRLISPIWLLECHNKKRLLPLDDFLL